MILPSAFAKLAINGRATIGFIPVRPSREVRRKNGTIYTSTPWTPRHGHHEALLSRTARSTIKVADVILGKHRTIVLADLLDPKLGSLITATGCKKTSVFADLWMRNYDRQWPILTEDLCTNCGGEKILPDGTECTDCDPVGVILIEEPQQPDIILEHFKERHGHTVVHAAHFEIDALASRFLSPAGRPRGDELGYTTTDLIDAGEAVPLSFQIRTSREASERDDELRRDLIDTGQLRGLGQAERNRRRSDQRRAA